MKNIDRCVDPCSQSSCLLKASRVVGQPFKEIFQKQKHHHKSDKHHHKRDYHKTKGNEVITEQEEIESKHNIKHNQSSQLMMSKFHLPNFPLPRVSVHWDITSLR